ncbi:DUF4253 domain-containing protein [Chitinophaga agrisoli]|nr:DUF4253 domain-containing protein [Chitinophaga agrisoli]
MKSILLLAGCLLLLLNASRASIPSTLSNKEKEYALADSMHFHHEIIELLHFTFTGEFARFTGKTPTNALAFICKGFWTLHDLLLINAYLKTMGYQFFWTQQSHEHLRPDTFVLIQSTDQFDILRLQGTCSPRNSLTTQGIISTLQRWYKSGAFNIISANSRWIEASFVLLPTPTDLKTLVQEESRLCPDIMNEKGITLKILEERHKRSKGFSLQWVADDNKYPASLPYAIIIFFICTLGVILLIWRRN